MATAILQPHDCLRDEFGNPRFRCRSRKRTPADVNRRNGLVMGQVKILKRGEELKPQVVKKKVVGLDLCSTDRLGPDPETVKREIRIPDLYAGVSAPHPSSLPFPTALVRRTVMETDLRKLLKI